MQRLCSNLESEIFNLEMINVQVLSLYDASAQLHAPSALPPRKKPPVPICVRSRVGSKAGMNAFILSVIKLTSL
jgi:hypothetical protein